MGRGKGGAKGKGNKQGKKGSARASKQDHVDAASKGSVDTPEEGSAAPSSEQDHVDAASSGSDDAPNKGSELQLVNNSSPSFFKEKVVFVNKVRLIGNGKKRRGKKGPMAASNKGSAAAASKQDHVNATSKGSVAASSSYHHPRSSKVCLFASCFVEHRGSDSDMDCDIDDIRHFYVFDLNQKPDGNFIPATPALRLRSKDFLAVGVLKSSLYLFDSVDMHSNVPKQNMYTYDLSSAAAEMARPYLILELDDMHKARCMNGFKRIACAIATPDQQKILVFSHVIVLGPNTHGLVDFELYDSLTKEWHPFPQLPDLNSKRFYESHSILSHAFLDNSTFFIHIDDKDRPTFILNLEKQNAGWVEYVSSPSLLNLSRMFFVVGGRLFFEYGVYDVVEEQRVYCIPSSPNARHRRQDDGRAITFLDRGKCEDGHTLCVLESNFDVSYRDPCDGEELVLYYPHVYIDVYKLKVASCCGVDQRPESMIS